MKKVYLISASLILGSLIWATFPSYIRAGLRPSFGGEYTNLCGSATADSYNCPADCNLDTGVCFARDRATGQNYTNVQKYICDGKLTDCDGSQAKFVSYSTVHGVNKDTAVQCNQTVQLDVFDNNDLKGFIVWYSGDCPVPTPTPQPTAVPTATPQPTVVPTTTPVPTVPVTTPTPFPTVPVINTRLSCPDGFVQTISGSTIICLQQIQNQTQTAQGGSAWANASTGPIHVQLASNSPVAQPQVVKVASAEVSNLPKTGLPLFAWAFSGFLPLGLRARKFGSNNKVASNLARFLWQEREFLRE